MSSTPTVLAEKSKSKKKRKDKGKSKEQAPGGHETASKHDEGPGKNEGVAPNWAYQPPDGMVLLDTSQVDEDFDWDMMKDDEDKELWIVRIPEGFKPKLLDGLQIQQPLRAPGAKLSTLERKHTKYDIWSVGQDATEDEGRPPRGEEVKNLSCLLPRKQKHGNFYLAPKHISQHIIITHCPATSNVDKGAALTPSTRYSVPKHLLKHRFLPLGALSSTDGIRHPADAMDVDVPNKSTGEGEGQNDEPSNLPRAVAQEQTPKKMHTQSPGTAGRKRKNLEGESETPKRRAKKLKA